ncbi:MAG: class F sortase [Actinomycetota bacterium]
MAARLGDRALRRRWRTGALAGVRSLSLLATILILAMNPAYTHTSTVPDIAVARLSRSTEMAVTRGAHFGVAFSSPDTFGPLFRPGLDLRAPPVNLPIDLRIPSLKVDAQMLGVGITRSAVMDAPMGSIDDPVWQEAFWYRGSGIPGDVGTATIAGHVSGGRGPSLFAHLHDLRRGDVIVIHDTRNGLDVRFTVAATKTYPLEQLAETSVLARIYGAGPVAGRGPQAAPDGVSHLTLITCAGRYDGSSYDHRLVVYAERTN